MTVEQVWSLITHWTKRTITLGLLVYIALVVAKLFGFNLIPITAYDAQATGVLLAGTAFAVSKL